MPVAWASNQEESTMETALYDRIGRGYDTTRRADPYIAGRLAELLAFGKEHTCLDIACGSGNYTSVLASRGGIWYGVDQSAEMLARARTKSSSVNWSAADVMTLPFEPRVFDKALCTLAIHHFPALLPAFAEVHRVIRPGGRFVLFTSLAEQMQHYWLCNYFPNAMQRSIEQMPSLAAIEHALCSAGFAIASTEPYSIRPDIEDFFLYSGKFRPTVYLDPAVRAGISTFAALADAEEVQEGCARIKADIASGHIYSVIEKSTHADGDYIFIIAENYAA